MRALLVAVVCGLAAPIAAMGQGAAARLPTELSNIRFNSGQGVVPYFEGWIRNPDGTFDLVFGYFNRNWQQELAIPAGPDNSVELGENQPTYFLPRRQRDVYRVRVPRDFGKKEVVWTITANGRTERGYGSLIPQQEITERVVLTNGGFDPGLTDANTPPSLTIAPVSSAAAGGAVTLMASVTDDGLPKPRVVRATPATSSAPFGGQINSSTAAPRPAGLTVTWMQYGGPGKVTFETTGPIGVTNGQAVTTARFAVPGTYQLMASASDRAMTTRVPVTVTVGGTAP